MQQFLHIHESVLQVTDHFFCHESRCVHECIWWGVWIWAHCWGLWVLCRLIQWSFLRERRLHCWSHWEKWDCIVDLIERNEITVSRLLWWMSWVNDLLHFLTDLMSKDKVSDESELSERDDIDHFSRPLKDSDELSQSDVIIEAHECCADWVNDLSWGNGDCIIDLIEKNEVAEGELLHQMSWVNDLLHSFTDFMNKDEVSDESEGSDELSWDNDEVWVIARKVLSDDEVREFWASAFRLWRLVLSDISTVLNKNLEMYEVRWKPDLTIYLISAS